MVTIAFGLRNLPEPGQGLLEFRRVLRPGGRLVVCEFSTPGGPGAARRLPRYLTRLMPVAARRLTCDPEAYQYLARSIGAWPDQPGLARWLQDAGFAEVAWRDLTGGIVALHRGVADAIAMAAGPFAVTHCAPYTPVDVLVRRFTNGRGRWEAR